MKKLLFLFISLFTINVYAEEKCYVTFQYDETKTIEVICGEPIETTAIPIIEKDFLGWYYEDEVFDMGTLITSDVILIAKYEKSNENKDNSTLSNTAVEESKSSNFYYDMSDETRKILLISLVVIIAIFKLIIIPKIKERKLKQQNKY